MKIRKDFKTYEEMEIFMRELIKKGVYWKLSSDPIANKYWVEYEEVVE